MRQGSKVAFREDPEGGDMHKNPVVFLTVLALVVIAAIGLIVLAIVS